MVHTRPHKYFVTRGRRYAKGDMKMRKRGISAALAAVLLVLTRWVKYTKNLHPILFILASAIVGVVFQF